MNLFGQKLFYSGKIGSIRAEVVAFGQNWLFLGKKWFYSGINWL